MYKLLSALIGLFISLMVLVNGRLSADSGNIGSSVIIHGSGLLIVLLMLALSRKKLTFRSDVSWYLYSGGFVGVLIILSNNAAFSALGVSLTLSLGLLGQTLASLLVDHYGLFGMAKHPFGMGRIVSLALIGAGIVCMMFV